MGYFPFIITILDVIGVIDVITMTEGSAEQSTYMAVR